MTNPQRHVTVRLWLAMPSPRLLGDVIHVQTHRSRRKAAVIATKPGSMLVAYAH